MRKFKLLIMVAVLLGAACKKSYTPPVTITTNVTNAEAADMAAGAVSLNSNGVANVSDDASLTATAYVALHLPCGTTKSDSLSRTSAPGATRLYSYSLKYSYTLNCNANNIPDNLTGSLIYGGNFNGPNISSANSGTANFTIAGLSPTANNYVINGEYKRTGTFQSKVDTSNHGNSSITIAIAALTVKKTTRAILSGTGTVTITGTVPKKGAFSYTGALVFNGDGTASLTVNGTVYRIDLATGVRTKL